MSKTLIAILSLTFVALTCVVIYFRRPIWAAIQKSYDVLKTGHQPKPATTHKETVIDVN